MLVTGLSCLLEASAEELEEIVERIGVDALRGVLSVKPHSVNAISGWQAKINLPREHHHRSLACIREILDASTLDETARQLALDTFVILARAESNVHGIPVENVTFHEVGALDSILDICISAALFSKLAPKNFYCSPLPICDGVIKCEHGYLSTPAPAVQEMLTDVPVYGLASSGETITPTAIAFLRASGARFGNWPEVNIKRIVRVYGGRILPDVPNGAIFSLAEEFSVSEC